VVELLLANKADVNARDKKGVTPLNLAAFYDHKDMAELLLAHGAHVNVYYATQTGDLEKLTALLKDNPDLVSSKDTWDDTPLHIAVQAAHKEVTVLLLAHKAEVNARNSSGDTPLHMAAAGGHKDLVELLLTSKAEVNAMDNNGKAPLHFAVLYNRQDVADLLRQCGGHE
jgi:ankyrin repeat protein